jgi:hypothetical protein
MTMEEKREILFHSIMIDEMCKLINPNNTKNYFAIDRAIKRFDDPNDRIHHINGYILPPKLKLIQLIVNEMCTIEPQLEVPKIIDACNDAFHIFDTVIAQAKETA